MAKKIRPKINDVPIQMEVKGKTTKSSTSKQQIPQQTLISSAFATANSSNQIASSGVGPLPSDENSKKNDVSMDSAKSSKSNNRRNKPKNPYVKVIDPLQEEFQCLVLDKNTDYANLDLATTNLLRKGITGATNFLNMIQGNSIYESAGDDQFIHSLCLLTNTPINYKANVENQALVEMIRDALYMISHDNLDIERIRQWKYGMEVVQELSTCRKNASLTKMISSIQDGYFKNANKVHDWFTIGIALPVR